MHHILVLIQDHYSVKSVYTARIRTNAAFICHIATLLHALQKKSITPE